MERGGFIEATLVVGPISRELIPRFSGLLLLSTASFEGKAAVKGVVSRLKSLSRREFVHSLERRKGSFIISCVSHSKNPRPRGRERETSLVELTSARENSRLSFSSLTLSAPFLRRVALFRPRRKKRGKKKKRKKISCLQFFPTASTDQFLFDFHDIPFDFSAFHLSHQSHHRR